MYKCIETIESLLYVRCYILCNLHSNAVATYSLHSNATEGGFVQNAFSLDRPINASFAAGFVQNTTKHYDIEYLTCPIHTEEDPLNECFFY